MSKRVYFVGSNMPGYMPDEPPFPAATIEHARECLTEEIERGREDDAQSRDYKPRRDPDGYFEACPYLALIRAIKSGQYDSGYAGDRFYFIEPGTMTAQELADCDQDPDEYENAEPPKARQEA